MNSSAGRPTIMVSSTGTAGSSTDTPVFRLNRFTNVMPSGANVGEIRFDGLTSVSSYTMPGYIVVNTTGASTATGSPSSMGFQTHNGTTNITSLSLDPNGASISTGTASTSTSTGALVLTGSGGLGVGGAIYAASVNATAGSLTTLSATGGIRIMTNNVYYAGTTTAAANQNLIGIGADDNTAVIAKSGQTLKMDVGASTIGTLSSTGLSVTGTKTNTYTGAGAGDIIQNSSDTSGTIFIAFNKAAGTAIGSVTRVTTTDAVAYNTTSDGDRKENIRDFTGSDSGPLIDALRPRWFDWKLDANDEFTTGKEADTVDEEGKVVEGKDIKTKRQDLRASHKARLVADSAQFIGFVAQEEDAADPVFARIGAVTRDANGVARARSDANLVPIIVAELQALRARVAALEAQNASFEARLDRATAQGVTP